MRKVTQTISTVKDFGPTGFCCWFGLVSESEGVALSVIIGVSRGLSSIIIGKPSNSSSSQ